ncbi:transposase [Streptomyces hypolithicus]
MVLYSSDVSDEQWALVEPVISAWKAGHPSVSGHQGRYAMREIVNAILYQNRTGCQWDLLLRARRGSYMPVSRRSRRCRWSRTCRRRSWQPR